jgi:hypothetical protein
MALIAKPEFQAVGDVLKFIEAHGGSIVMSTVSKALKRLESDLAIERPSHGGVRVISSEHLLDQLSQYYQPPKPLDTWLGRIDLDQQALYDHMLQIEKKGDFIQTGMSSACKYVTFSGEPVLEYYTRQPITNFLSTVEHGAKETRSFPNLRLIQTEDQRVYFNPQPNLSASPLQTWLEMTSGDKRSREAAEPLKKKICRDAERSHGE